MVSNQVLPTEALRCDLGTWLAGHLHFEGRFELSGLACYFASLYNAIDSKFVACLSST